MEKNSIIVKVSELRSKLQDIRRSGCELVCLTILDADESNGEPLPPCITFTACKEYNPDEWIDFEEVEAVSNENELTEKLLYGTVMGSNLL